MPKNDTAELSEYPGYLIKESGEIISKRMNKPMGQETVKGGYKRVSIINKNGVRKHVLVHRLIAMAFVPNPNNEEQVNHLDEDKTNNHADNLEWCSRKRNVNYGTAQQRRSEKRKKKVLNLDTGEVFSSISEAEKTINSGYTHISQACKNSNRTCGGYHWKFIG